MIKVDSMASIKKTLGLEGDVVSSMSLGETAVAGVVGGIVSGLETTMLPSTLPTPIIGIGNVAAGLALKGMIKGSAGNVLGNALTITGAVGLGQWGANFLMDMLGVGSQAVAGDSSADMTADTTLY
jgi:hypothetical protein